MKITIPKALYMGNIVSGDTAMILDLLITMKNNKRFFVTEENRTILFEILYKSKHEKIPIRVTLELLEKEDEN